MQTAKIILLCTLSAIAYGVLHDQVTARICVEYFTKGHPPIFDTEDPTLLGLGWGVVATWWVGAGLGVLLSIVARAGKRPKRSAESLVRPVLRLMAIAAVLAAVAGACGYMLGKMGLVRLDLYARMALQPENPEPQVLGAPGFELWPVDPDLEARFLADLWAHSMSYFAGFIGGIVVAIHVWRSRCVFSSVSTSKSASMSSAPDH